AHLYVQTSRHESQGMSLLEAMACGRPAIGTPVGVLPQVSPCPPSAEPEALAAAAADLLSDPGRYTALAAEARRRVEAEFSLAAAAAGLEALWGALAQGAPRPARLYNQRQP
ncbi:MAG: glycosyltransferase, partial [Candidatus Promineifilaceae bacterium]